MEAPGPTAPPMLFPTAEAPVSEGPHPACNICGDGDTVTNPSASIFIPGQFAATYGELFQGGERGYINSSNCSLLPLALSAWGCNCGPNPGSSTSVPALCFSDQMVVDTPSDPRTVVEGQAGDSVVHNGVEELIISLSHDASGEMAEFLEIHTENGAWIQIMADHLTFASSNKELILASDVVVGDELLRVSQGGTEHLQKVISIATVHAKGLRAPIIGSGNVTTNRILASSHVTLQPGSAWLVIEGRWCLGKWHDIAYSFGSAQGGMPVAFRYLVC